MRIASPTVLLLCLLIGALALSGSLAAQEAEPAKKILDGAKAEIESISLLLLRKGQVVAKMQGKRAENHEDGGVEVHDATFLVYPSDDTDEAKPAEGLKPEERQTLAPPIATITAGHMLWYQARNEVFLSEKLAITWLSVGPDGSERETSVRAQAGTLQYEIRALEEDQEATETKASADISLKLIKASDVEFSGLDLSVRAVEMRIELELDALEPQSKGAARERRVRSLSMDAGKGAEISFPASILRVVGERDSEENPGSLIASNGGQASLRFARDADASRHPLSISMKGRVHLVDSTANQELMRATNMSVSALISDPKANSKAGENLTIQRLTLDQKARASINEVTTSGDRIVVDLERVYQRELIITGGAELTIEPKSAAGEVRIRDLASVVLRAKREIRILETRDINDESQESAISALEEASADFGMAEGAAFRLRGNEVHFTLQRSISEAKSTKRARYSLRNLAEFACFGSGVRPLLTWHEGGVRRVAFFAESLVAERLRGEQIRIQAKGTSVRASLIPIGEIAGIGRMLKSDEHQTREIWLTAEAGLQAVVPLSLIDPDLDEREATNIEMVAQRAIHYEELDGGGKTFNAIEANGMTLTLAFGVRQEGQTRRKLESFELYLGRQRERSVRMGLGADIIVCRTASIQVRNDSVLVRMNREVEVWWHSAALLDPIAAGFGRFTANMPGPKQKPDLIALRSELIEIETTLGGNRMHLTNDGEIEIDLLDSGRVSWGLGDDALLEHDRQAGVAAITIATFRGKSLTVDRDPEHMTIATKEPVVFRAKDSELDASALTLATLNQNRAELTLAGPVLFKAIGSGLDLFADALRRGTGGARDERSRYAKGLTLKSDGPLIFTTETRNPAPIEDSSAESATPPKQPESEVTYSIHLPEPFTITAQEADDPLTLEVGRIDSISAGSLEAVIIDIEAPDSTSPGNIPVISAFRLNKDVDVKFKDATLKGDRLFYDRTSDRFVLGGVQTDTKHLGIEVEGIERIEVRFPVLSQSKAKENEKDPKVDGRREWRLVGNRIKLRKSKKEEKTKEE